MEIACNLTSGFGFKSSGEGSNLLSYQSICSHIQKKLFILKKVQVRRYSYSEHLKPNLPNLNNTKSPIERNLLKLDASIEQNLLRLDASIEQNLLKLDASIEQNLLKLDASLYKFI
jgi:hypothetical protein